MRTVGTVSNDFQRRVDRDEERLAPEELLLEIRTLREWLWEADRKLARKNQDVADLRRENAMLQQAERAESKRKKAQLRTLGSEVHFLEGQLRADRPYSRIYNLGAGSLFVATISLVFWALTGIGAPFHPIFAAATIPASIGVIAMAFFIRREGEKGKSPAD